MMKLLFRKLIDKETTGPKEFRNGMLWVITNTLKKWGYRMGKKTEHLSRRTMLLLLLTFTALTGSYSAYLVGKSLMCNQTQPVSVSGIEKPAYILQAGDVISKPGTIISKTEYNRITLFREYMDSLAQSPEGKAVHDSIISNRPGLMDSVRLIEKIYQLEIK